MERNLKLAIYVGALALVIWALWKAFNPPKASVGACARPGSPQAKGNVWARKSVPVPSSATAQVVGIPSFVIPPAQR